MNIKILTQEAQALGKRETNGSLYAFSPFPLLIFRFSYHVNYFGAFLVQLLK